jgi:hypothetical protein
MGDRDDEEDIETMVANRQMLIGLEATVRGSHVPPPPSFPPPQGSPQGMQPAQAAAPGSNAPPRSPDFPAGLIKTMPMAPPAHAVLSAAGAEAEGEGEGMPQLVVNFLLICGVITAFGLMTLIYLNI